MAPKEVPGDEGIISRTRAQERLRREYDERRRVIQIVEQYDETARERSQDLRTFFVVAVILTLFTAITCWIILFDVFSPGTTEYYTFFFVAPVIAYEVSFWALLYIRRARQRRSYELESTLSIFQRELSRNWERNDALERENRRLRELVASHNPVMHRIYDQDGMPSE